MHGKALWCMLTCNSPAKCRKAFIRVSHVCMTQRLPDLQPGRLAITHCTAWYLPVLGTVSFA